VGNKEKVSASEASYSSMDVARKIKSAPILQSLLNSSSSNPCELIVEPMLLFGDSYHDFPLSGICTESKSTTEFRDQNDLKEIEQLKMLSYEKLLQNSKEQILLERKEVNTLKGERVLWEASKTKLQEELAKVKNDFKQQKSKYNKLTKHVLGSEKTIEELKREISVLEAEATENGKSKSVLLDEARSLINDLSTKNEQLQNEKDDLVLELLSRNEEIDVSRAQLEEAKMRQRILETRVQEIETERHLVARCGESKTSSSKQGGGHIEKQSILTSPAKVKPETLSMHSKNQLVKLMERHSKLKGLPETEKNLELIGKLEKAMEGILSNSTKAPLNL